MLFKRHAHSPGIEKGRASSLSQQAGRSGFGTCKTPNETEKQRKAEDRATSVSVGDGMQLHKGSIRSCSSCRDCCRSPIGGSVPLFLFGTALHLFAMTSVRIFLATVGGTMPQFGLLLMLVLMPLQMLSGATTPRESMPEIIQNIMLAAPNTHFVILAQAVLFRGAGLAVVWPQLAALPAIGAIPFWYSLRRFRQFLR